MEKLTEEQRNKLDEYLPNNGPTKYLETEVYRAICKIHYDCDNNGFGNNWKFPFIFLCVMDDLNNHEILGPDYVRFYELKHYCVGCSLEDNEFHRISDMISDFRDHVENWVFNKLNNLTSSNVDMWNIDTWVDKFESADLNEFDNFGDSEQWENQFDAWNYIVEGGWENFENNNYNPENDYEYSRFKNSRRW